IGSRSQWGAELEGLHTHRHHRRKGHALLNLGQISRHLLSSLPRLSLRVSEQDEVTAKIARRVGYVAGATQRLVLMGNARVRERGPTVSAPRPTPQRRPLRGDSPVVPHSRTDPAWLPNALLHFALVPIYHAPRR